MNRTLPCYLARIAVIALLLLTSCAPLRDRRTLNDMEALMPERPDSALAVLRGLQPRDLPGLHVRPLHALLLSEALDKNYIDLTDDSLALAANNYYGDHGSKLHRLKSWYYLGRIRFNAGNYAEAVICYNKALEYAEALNNNHYIGLINREIANAYSEVWDIYHAEEYIQKSIDAFGSSGEERYAAYSKLSLARLLRTHLDYDGCDSVLNEMLDFLDDDYLIACVYELKGLNALSKENPDVDEVLYCYNKAHIGRTLPINSSRLASLACVQQLVGQNDSSDLYLKKASYLARTKEDSIVVTFDGFRQARLRMDNEVAIDRLEDYLKLQDSAVSKSLEQSVSFYQSNYYMNESRLNAMRTRITTLSYGIVVLLLVILALYLFSTNRKHRMRIIEEIVRTEEVLNDLELIRNEKKEMGRIIATLFENRINILDTLSEQYEMIDDSHQRKMREKGRELSRDEIVASFKKAMRNLRKDKDITVSLEDTLNIWKDGIMEKLRHVFGNGSTSKIKMTDEDFKFAPYYFSGLKQKTISYLTGYSEPAIKERKYRMKMKIEALDDSFSEEKALFLSSL